MEELQGRSESLSNCLRLLVTPRALHLLQKVPIRYTESARDPRIAGREGKMCCEGRAYILPILHHHFPVCFLSEA